ncbi:MAG TPA: hypothetical protein VF008_27530 [Niastella sp.]
MNGAKESRGWVIDTFSEEISFYRLHNNQQTQLSLHNLAAGLYFLQLANGQIMKIMRQD